MARLRFPGRPGYRFDRIGVRFGADEASQTTDHTLSIVSSIHQGLRRFKELFGDSDEEDDFHGFTKKEISLAEACVLRLAKAEQMLREKQEEELKESYQRSHARLADLEASGLPISRLPANFRDTYGCVVRSGLVEPRSKLKGNQAINNLTDNGGGTYKVKTATMNRIKLKRLTHTIETPGVPRKPVGRRKKIVVTTEGGQTRVEDGIPNITEGQPSSLSQSSSFSSKYKTLTHQLLAKATKHAATYKKNKKAFVMPTKSSRSSRVIKPTKRFLEEDIDTSTLSVGKQPKMAPTWSSSIGPVVDSSNAPISMFGLDPYEDNKINAFSSFQGQGLPLSPFSANREKGFPAFSSAPQPSGTSSFSDVCSSQDKPIGLLDQPLIVEGKRAKKPSLIMRMKLVEDNPEDEIRLQQQILDISSPTKGSSSSLPNAASGAANTSASCFSGNQSPLSSEVVNKRFGTMKSLIAPAKLFTDSTDALLYQSSMGKKRKRGRPCLARPQNNTIVLRQAKLQLNRTALNRSKAALARSLKAQLKQEAKWERKRKLMEQEQESEGSSSLFGQPSSSLSQLSPFSQLHATGVDKQKSGLFEGLEDGVGSFSPDGFASDQQPISEVKLEELPTSVALTTDDIKTQDGCKTKSKKSKDLKMAEAQCCASLQQFDERCKMTYHVGYIGPCLVCQAVAKVNLNLVLPMKPLCKLCRKFYQNHKAIARLKKNKALKLCPHYGRCVIHHEIDRSKLCRSCRIQKFLKAINFPNRWKGESPLLTRRSILPKSLSDSYQVMSGPANTKDPTKKKKHKMKLERQIKSESGILEGDSLTVKMEGDPTIDLTATASTTPRRSKHRSGSGDGGKSRSVGKGHMHDSSIPLVIDMGDDGDNNDDLHRKELSSSKKKRKSKFKQENKSQEHHSSPTKKYQENGGETTGTTPTTPKRHRNKSGGGGHKDFSNKWTPNKESNSLKGYDKPLSVDVGNADIDMSPSRWSVDDFQSPSRRTSTSASVSPSKRLTNGESSELTVTERMSSRGPRIKHVCRRAAMVFPQQRATFGDVTDTTNQRTLTLSALPSKEKQEILARTKSDQKKVVSSDEDDSANEATTPAASMKSTTENDMTTTVGDTATAAHSDGAKPQDLPSLIEVKGEKVAGETVDDVEDPFLEDREKAVAIAMKMLAGEEEDGDDVTMAKDSPLKKEVADGEHKRNKKLALRKQRILGEKGKLKKKLKIPGQLRRVKCGNCPGCQTKECGICIACKDKPKFGGANKLRKGCIEQACSNPHYPRKATRAFITPKSPSEMKPQLDNGDVDHNDNVDEEADFDDVMVADDNSKDYKPPSSYFLGSSSRNGNKKRGGKKEDESDSKASVESSSTTTASAKRNGLDMDGSVAMPSVKGPKSQPGHGGRKRFPSKMLEATVNVALADVRMPPSLGKMFASHDLYDKSGGWKKDKLTSKNSTLELLPIKSKTAYASEVTLKTHLIRADYKSGYEVETAWTHGFSLTLTGPSCIRTLCYLCGAAGKEELIFCIVCCQPFHDFCLEDYERPECGLAEDHMALVMEDDGEDYNQHHVRSGSIYWCCRQCQFCNVCGQQNGLLKCHRCRDMYHPECLGPNYPTKPSRKKNIWVCTKCVRCKSCGATTPGVGTNATWTYDFSLCYKCGKLMDKGNFCPVCHKCYSDDDWESKMIHCAVCESWVHAKCEELTDEMYQLLSYLPDEVVFTCRVCCPSRPRHWEEVLQSEFLKGLLHIVNTLMGSKCTQSLMEAGPPRESNKRSVGGVGVKLSAVECGEMGVKSHSPLSSPNNLSANGSTTETASSVGDGNDSLDSFSSCVLMDQQKESAKRDKDDDDNDDVQGVGVKSGADSRLVDVDMGGDVELMDDGGSFCGQESTSNGRKSVAVVKEEEGGSVNEKSSKDNRESCRSSGCIIGASSRDDNDEDSGSGGFVARGSCSTDDNEDCVDKTLGTVMRNLTPVKDHEQTSVTETKSDSINMTEEQNASPSTFAATTIHNVVDLVDSNVAVVDNSNSASPNEELNPSQCHSHTTQSVISSCQSLSSSTVSLISSTLSSSSSTTKGVEANTSCAVTSSSPSLLLSPPSSFNETNVSMSPSKAPTVIVDLSSASSSSLSVPVSISSHLSPPTTQSQSTPIKPSPGQRPTPHTTSDLHPLQSPLVDTHPNPNNPSTCTSSLSLPSLLSLTKTDKNPTIKEKESGTSDGISPSTSYCNTQTTSSTKASVTKNLFLEPEVMEKRKNEKVESHPQRDYSNDSSSSNNAPTSSSCLQNPIHSPHSQLNANQLPPTTEALPDVIDLTSVSPSKSPSQTHSGIQPETFSILKQCLEKNIETSSTLNASSLTSTPVLQQGKCGERQPQTQQYPFQLMDTNQLLALTTTGHLTPKKGGKTPDAEVSVTSGALVPVAKDDLNDPKNFLAVKAKIQCGSYDCLDSFNEDMVRIIQWTLSQSESFVTRKKQAHSMRSIFIKLMERSFPWFNVNMCKLWEHNKNLPVGMLKEAVLPPYEDHTYAQWLERQEIPMVPQPSPFKKLMGSPQGITFSNDEISPEKLSDQLDKPLGVGGSVLSDNRCCLLCGGYGDQMPQDCGRLLYCGQDDWVHINCALWSAEVFEADDGSLQNVQDCMSRGRKMRCNLCQMLGATVGCCASNCPANFHFMCARQEGGNLFQKDKRMYCRQHADWLTDEVVEGEGFETRRRVCVDIDKTKNKGWSRAADPALIHVVFGSCTVESLGVLSAALSDTADVLLPINFCCTRIYWSTRDARRRCVYTCRIVEVKPVAEVSEVQIQDMRIVHDEDHPDFVPFHQLDLKGINIPGLSSEDPATTALNDDLIYNTMSSTIQPSRRLHRSSSVPEERTKINYSGLSASTLELLNIKKPEGCLPPPSKKIRPFLATNTESNSSSVKNNNVCEDLGILNIANRLNSAASTMIKKKNLLRSMGAAQLSHRQPAALRRGRCASASPVLGMGATSTPQDILVDRRARSESPYTGQQLIGTSMMKNTCKSIVVMKSIITKRCVSEPPQPSVCHGNQLRPSALSIPLAIEEESVDEKSAESHDEEDMGVEERCVKRLDDNEDCVIMSTSGSRDGEVSKDSHVPPSSLTLSLVAGDEKQCSESLGVQKAKTCGGEQEKEGRSGSEGEDKEEEDGGSCKKGDAKENGACQMNGGGGGGDVCKDREGNGGRKEEEEDDGEDDDKKRREIFDDKDVVIIDDDEEKKKEEEKNGPEIKSLRDGVDQENSEMIEDKYSCSSETFHSANEVIVSKSNIDENTAVENELSGESLGHQMQSNIDKDRLSSDSSVANCQTETGSLEKRDESAGDDAAPVIGTKWVSDSNTDGGGDSDILVIEDFCVEGNVESDDGKRDNKKEIERENTNKVERGESCAKDEIGIDDSMKRGSNSQKSDNDDKLKQAVDNEQENRNNGLIEDDEHSILESNVEKHLSPGARRNSYIEKDEVKDVIIVDDDIAEPVNKDNENNERKSRNKDDLFDEIKKEANRKDTVKHEDMQMEIGEEVKYEREGNKECQNGEQSKGCKEEGEVKEEDKEGFKRELDTKSCNIEDRNEEKKRQKVEGDNMGKFCESLDDGPIKCEKCGQEYRTKESCLSHVKQCQMVDNSSASDDEEEEVPAKRETRSQTSRTTMPQQSPTIGTKSDTQKIRSVSSSNFSSDKKAMEKTSMVVLNQKQEFPPKRAVNIHEPLSIIISDDCTGEKISPVLSTDDSSMHSQDSKRSLRRSTVKQRNAAPAHLAKTRQRGDTGSRSTLSPDGSTCSSVASSSKDCGITGERGMRGGGSVEEKASPKETMLEAVGLVSRRSLDTNPMSPNSDMESSSPLKLQPRMSPSELCVTSKREKKSPGASGNSGSRKLSIMSGGSGGKKHKDGGRGSGEATAHLKTVKISCPSPVEEVTLVDKSRVKRKRQKRIWWVEEEEEEEEGGDEEVNEAEEGGSGKEEEERDGELESVGVARRTRHRLSEDQKRSAVGFTEISETHVGVESRSRRTRGSVDKMERQKGGEKVEKSQLSPQSPRISKRRSSSRLSVNDEKLDSTTKESEDADADSKVEGDQDKGVCRMSKSKGKQEVDGDDEVDAAALDADVSPTTDIKEGDKKEGKEEDIVSPLRRSHRSADKSAKMSEYIALLKEGEDGPLEGVRRGRGRPRIHPLPGARDEGRMEKEEGSEFKVEEDKKKVDELMLIDTQEENTAKTNEEKKQREESQADNDREKKDEDSKADHDGEKKEEEEKRMLEDDKSKTSEETNKSAPMEWEQDVIDLTGDDNDDGNNNAENDVNNVRNSQTGSDIPTEKTIEASGSNVVSSNLLPKHIAQMMKSEGHKLRIVVRSPNMEAANKIGELLRKTAINISPSNKEVTVTTDLKTKEQKQLVEGGGNDVSKETEDNGHDELGKEGERLIIDKSIEQKKKDVDGETATNSVVTVEDSFKLSPVNRQSRSNTASPDSLSAAYDIQSDDFSSETSNDGYDDSSSSLMVAHNKETDDNGNNNDDDNLKDSVSGGRRQVVEPSTKNENPIEKVDNKDEDDDDDVIIVNAHGLQSPDPVNRNKSNVSSSSKYEIAISYAGNNPSNINPQLCIKTQSSPVSQNICSAFSSPTGSHSVLTANNNPQSSSLNISQHQQAPQQQPQSVIIADIPSGRFVLRPGATSSSQQNTHTPTNLLPIPTPQPTNQSASSLLQTLGGSLSSSLSSSQHNVLFPQPQASLLLPQQQLASPPGLLVQKPTPFPNTDRHTAFPSIQGHINPASSLLQPTSALPFVSLTGTHGLSLTPQLNLQATLNPNTPILQTGVALNASGQPVMLTSQPVITPTPPQPSIYLPPPPQQIPSLITPQPSTLLQTLQLPPLSTPTSFLQINQNHSPVNQQSTLFNHSPHKQTLNTQQQFNPSPPKQPLNIPHQWTGSNTATTTTPVSALPGSIQSQSTITTSSSSSKPLPILSHLNPNTSNNQPQQMPVLSSISQTQALSATPSSITAITASFLSSQSATTSTSSTSARPQETFNNSKPQPLDDPNRKQINYMGSFELNSSNLQSLFKATAASPPHQPIPSSSSLSLPSELEKNRSKTIMELVKLALANRNKSVPGVEVRPVITDTPNGPRKVLRVFIDEDYLNSKEKNMATTNTTTDLATTSNPTSLVSCGSVSQSGFPQFTHLLNPNTHNNNSDTITTTTTAPSGQPLLNPPIIPYHRGKVGCNAIQQGLHMRRPLKLVHSSQAQKRKKAALSTIDMANDSKRRHIAPPSQESVNLNFSPEQPWSRHQTPLTTSTNSSTGSNLRSIFDSQASRYPPYRPLQQRPSSSTPLVYDNVPNFSSISSNLTASTAITLQDPQRDREPVSFSMTEHSYHHLQKSSDRPRLQPSSGAIGMGSPHKRASFPQGHNKVCRKKIEGLDGNAEATEGDKKASAAGGLLKRKKKMTTQQLRMPTDENQDVKKKKKGNQKLGRIKGNAGGAHPIIHHKKADSSLPQPSLEEEVVDTPFDLVGRGGVKAIGGSAQGMGNEGRLKFEITSDDGFSCQGDTMEDAWNQVVEKVKDVRAASRMKQLSYAGLSGKTMFGVDHDSVVYLIEQLYGAVHCHQQYRFKFHRYDLDLAHQEVPLNPSGCARTEGFKSRKPFDMFNFLKSVYRIKPGQDEREKEEEMELKSARRATSLSLPMAMRFRKLKTFAKEAVDVYRSKIHGRGLFCKRNIDAGEMVIEYAGEVIRASLTDKREKYYESKGIGCYMFRIDDDEVVDATMHGSAARFINHSCEPNCFSKVIQVDGKKHIVIFAVRPIKRGEELTYDYKFPIEEVKIPCHCESKKCRKYLN